MPLFNCESYIAVENHLMGRLKYVKLYLNYNHRQNCWEGYLSFSPLCPHPPLSKLLLTQLLNLHCILYGRLQHWIWWRGGGGGYKKRCTRLKLS